MKEVLFTITENRPLAPQVYALRLCGDTLAITAPGQFLELQLPGFSCAARCPSATGMMPV